MNSKQLPQLEDRGMSLLLVLSDKIDGLRVDTSVTPAKDIGGNNKQVAELGRLNDIAALLPRRESKLHGGIISDSGSDMSYSNICKQIDDGLKEKFPESEIIGTVLRLTKAGSFKDVLTSKEDLTVETPQQFKR